MPVRVKETYYKPIQKELESYFYDFYWRDILQAVKDNERLFNTNDALIAAIRKGTIHYEQGTFTGKFNARISKELSKFAKFNGRTKTWKGIPPSNVTAAATITRSRGETLAWRIEGLINDMPGRVSEAVGKLQYSIYEPLKAVSEEAGKDLANLGISVDMTPELSERLMDNYTNNMNLNILNPDGSDWTTKQVTRLRDMIQKNSLSGYNRLELQNLIANEFGGSMNKARFLARQETSLFVAEVRDNRYEDAGITKYKWSSSHDVRVRELHDELNGKVFSYSSPPIIDDNTGERGVPGQAFGCRCVAIAIL